MAYIGQNITNNYKFNVDIALTALSATNVMTWRCHVDVSVKGIYDMIIGRYLVTELGII